jgi:pimeloyl-ACP methyl ester carboxylesterase
MTLPALVLVHGGEHSADCWDLTIDELHRQAPELRLLTVDLPSHRATPGDLKHRDDRQLGGIGRGADRGCRI